MTLSAHFTTCGRCHARDFDNLGQGVYISSKSEYCTKVRGGDEDNVVGWTEGDDIREEHDVGGRKTESDTRDKREAYLKTYPVKENLQGVKSLRCCNGAVFTRGYDCLSYIWLRK